jgi:tetratricopeptide (TPR) repeat protein
MSCRLSRLSLSVFFVLSVVSVLSAQSEPAAFTARAVAAMAAGDFHAAVAAADSALAREPESAAVQLVLGQAYLSHARANPGLGAIGKVKKGRAAVERAIALDPNNLDARATLLQFLLQAPGIVGGSRDAAREQALEIERRDRERGLLARLNVATVGGRKEEILDVYEDALPLLEVRTGPSAALARAFMEAARKLKSKDLREDLTARVYAAVRDDATLSP